MGDEYSVGNFLAQSYAQPKIIRSEDHNPCADRHSSVMTTQSAPKPAVLATRVVIARPGFLTPQIDPAIAPQLSLSIAPHITNGTSPKLYLVPTPQGLPDEEIDPLYAPKPSALHELPAIRPMVENYVIGVMEIWSGRRSALQLARSSHRLVYQKLLTPPSLSSGTSASSNSAQIRGPSISTNSSRGNSPRIRKIYISQPIEGVLEVTVTLRIGERVRSLSLRFEGVDNRWLCTEFTLL